MKIALIIALLAAAAYGQDIKVLLDNDWVTVTHIIDHPGDKRPTHTHKDSVVIALTDHKRRVIGETTRDIDVKANAAMWFADVTHSEENIGKTDGELLIVDVKKRSGLTANDPMDAVTAAPKNHKILFENDRVRVLAVTVEPGEKEPLHKHTMPAVIYVISREDILDTDSGGKTLLDTRALTNPPTKNFAVWIESQPAHHVQNRAKTPVKLIRVELK
jgi:hypothetical protein